MIKLADKIDNIYQICLKDTFGTRIAALFSAYGTEYDFADFWYQTVNDRITAAVSKVSGDVTICADMNADFEELSEFMNAIGYSSITADLSVANNMNLQFATEGFIVEFKGDIVLCDDIIEDYCDLNEIYDLIKSQGVGFLGDKKEWIADASYKLNHNIARLALIKKDGKLASSAMVLFETDNAAFLGAVATYPDFRGQGLSRKIIHYLLNKVKGKKTHLFCRKDTIVEFYKKIGFEVVGTFTVTYSKG